MTNLSPVQYADLDRDWCAVRGTPVPNKVKHIFIIYLLIILFFFKKSFLQIQILKIFYRAKFRKTWFLEFF